MGDAARNIDDLVVTLTVAQLRAIVREELAAARPAEFAAPNAPASAEWLTQEQACALLGYTPQHMRRLGIPRHKRGRRVRYRRAELEAWMLASEERKTV